MKKIEQVKITEFLQFFKDYLQNKNILITHNNYSYRKSDFTSKYVIRFLVSIILFEQDRIFI